MFVCEISEQRFDPSRPWEVSVFLPKAFYNWAIKRNGALKFKPLFLNSRETNYKRLIDCDGACPRRQINLPMARGVIKKPFGATGWRALVIGWLQDLKCHLVKRTCYVRTKLWPLWKTLSGCKTLLLCTTIKTPRILSRRIFSFTNQIFAPFVRFSLALFVTSCIAHF